MNPRRWSRGSVVSFGLWSLTLQTIVLAPVRTAEPSSRDGADSGPRVRLPAGLAAITVNQAIEGAKRKLAKAECQAVLNEFTDASGHSLAVILLEREKTAPQYLGELVFYDGREVARCQKLETAAVTTPGSRVIFICSSVLLRAAQRGGAAENIIIHDMLDSLGLRENPPSSYEITAAVTNRCR